MEKVVVTTFVKNHSKGRTKNSIVKIYDVEEFVASEKKFNGLCFKPVNSDSFMFLPFEGYDIVKIENSENKNLNKKDSEYVIIIYFNKGIKPITYSINDIKKNITFENSYLKIHTISEEDVWIKYSSISKFFINARN